MIGIINSRGRECLTAPACRMNAAALQARFIHAYSTRRWLHTGEFSDSYGERKGSFFGSLRDSEEKAH